MAKEFPIGIPLHQIPKDRAYRRLIKPPPGHVFIVADVDSQETHLMAEQSKDEALMDVYVNGLNPHGLTASKIGNCSYDDVVNGKQGKDAYFERLYKSGKVTNLAKNYRCGIQSTYEMAHVQGQMPDVTKDEVKTWLDVWKATYKGVPKYWDKAIEKAKYYGYAETLAGRRFGIHLFERNEIIKYLSNSAEYKKADQKKKNEMINLIRWKSESSAIMVPIQGSGADMKYLAIAIMARRFPELTYWGEIHDEIVYTYKIPLPSFNGIYFSPRGDRLDVETLTRPKCKEVKKALDNLPFKKAWGWRPEIPFTWTVGYGTSWGEIKEC
jgi:DNA polymerase-1